MLYIILLSQILNFTAELVIPTGIPSKEAKAEMEMQPVFAVAKIRKCSIQKQPTRVVPGKKCSEDMQQITGEHPCQSVILIKLQS